MIPVVQRDEFLDKGNGRVFAPLSQSRAFFDTIRIV